MNEGRQEEGPVSSGVGRLRWRCVALRMLVLGVLTSFLVGAVQSTHATASLSAALTETQGAVIEIHNPELADSPQLAIEGSVIVLAIDDPENYRTEVLVETDQGTVRIGGELDAVTTGSAFVGTVALPSSVTARLDARHSERVQSPISEPIEPGSADGTVLMRAVTNEQAVLQVVTASIELAASVIGTAAHIVDVVVLNGAPVSVAAVDSLVADLEEFWVSQSEESVTSITRPRPVQYYNSGWLASCNYTSLWNQAATRFGHTSATSYMELSGRHLVVLSDQCGAGIASVGPAMNGSGVIFVNVETELDLHLLAHEFGHNLGLGHSSVHECSDAALVEGTPEQGCYDEEYGDLYDVMSMAYTYGSYTTNRSAALNVTHRAWLGLLSPTELHVVTGLTETVSLRPAAATSGLRGIVVDDPFGGSVLGDTYYVEFRSGTLRDAGKFYTLPFEAGVFDELRVGVRILKLRPGSGGGRESVVLAQLPDSDGYPQLKSLALKPGQNFITPSGGLTITYNGMVGDNASVTVDRAEIPTVDRIAGASRYTTAVAISEFAYPSGAPVVYIAFGGNYPDALAAAPAAVKEGGPLLLTEGHKLTPVVADEIERLNPAKIVVVGGTGVVFPEVEAALKAIQPNTVRLGGGNRYVTAQLIVDYAFDTATVAFVATGTGFPDALSASAAAGAIGAPVVLINGSLGTVDAPTRQLLTDLGVADIRIAGGTGVVSNGVQSSLETVAPVTRAAGTNRFHTNQLINGAIFATSPTVYLATGYEFPDALAGAALAGAQGVPLYLSQTDCVPRPTRAAVLRSDAGNVWLLGGPGALTANVLALKPC